MIYYFSATCNSKYVACRIARETGTKAVSILAATEEECGIKADEDDLLGFVFPTYAWVMPTLFEEFIKKVSLKDGNRPYVFVVATCGATSGCSVSLAKKILFSNGITTDASFDIRMPDTWTPIFDLSHRERNDERNKKAEGEISAVTGRIKRREKGVFNSTRAPWQIAPLGRLIYAAMRRTGRFKVKDNCKGCGSCADSCPTGVLKMEEGYPVWTEKKCMMCLRCLHTCPAFAIQYGRATERHGQYVHPGAGRPD